MNFPDRIGNVPLGASETGAVDIIVMDDVLYRSPPWCPSRRRCCSGPPRSGWDSRLAGGTPSGSLHFRLLCPTGVEPSRRPWRVAAIRAAAEGDRYVARRLSLFAFFPAARA